MMKKPVIEDGKIKVFEPNNKFYIGVIIVFLLASITVFIWGIGNSRNKPMETQNTVRDDDDSPLTKPKFNEEYKTFEVSVVEDSLNHVGKLVTSKYFFKEVITQSKGRNWGWFSKLSESSVMVSYEGYVNAGVDFEGITVAKDDDEKKITVTVPRAEIQDVVLDNDSFEQLSEKDSVFTKLKFEDFNDAAKELKENAKENALQRGILGEADKNAMNMIRNMVNELTANSGYTVEVTQ